MNIENSMYACIQTCIENILRKYNKNDGNI